MTRSRFVPALLLVLWTAAAAAPVAAAAASRDVDVKRFPRLVRVFLLPDEVALLKELKDDKDRLEFQRIFWARRDPTPGTPANEFEDNVRAAWARSDDLFSYPAQKGAETGCGQVLALLGRPEEVVGKGAVPRQRANADELQPRSGSNAAAAAAPGSGRQYDSMAYLRDGSNREPEAWVYRDREGRPFKFTGAELSVGFDAECRYPEGAGILGDDLRRAAEAFLTRPDIAYAKGADGHLLPLAVSAASAGASVGARALLAAPRADFALAAEPKLIMRAPKGEAYVAGLASAPAGVAAAGGGPKHLSLAVEAKDASGKAVASAAREATAAVQVDGSLVASWGLALPPGKYSVSVAAATPDAKGAVSTIDVEVPDLGGSALVASPLVLYPDEPSAAGRPDPRDPFAAFQMGGQVLRLRHGNAFSPKDALLVVAAVYGGKTDPASGLAALKSRFTILKDGKPVARGAEDAYDTADAVASVGPIPLAGYAPGAYVVRLDVTDGVSKETLRREASLEIRP
jgi:GWxTD domain-containing protein